VIGAYLAIDAGLVQSDANLPFHIFNKQKTSKSSAPVITPQPLSPDTTTNPIALPSNVPAGFTEYKIAKTNASFDYPTVWGAPTVIADPGFSKRGGTNKSDGAHSYKVNFAVNKAVEVTVTSSKYLPAARATMYNDFLQWCMGTIDKKFYKQSLHFSSTAGVDSPSTILCDQGPLNDATKLNEKTIVQQKTKDVDGKTVLGDIYTQNLTDTEFTVLRVKDTTMTNADNIKKLLDTVKIAS
jgi:hypothetical protein